MKQDLAHIRDVGFAVSVGDVEIGISAVAAPILNAKSEVLGAAAIVNIGAKWSDNDVLERGERMSTVCREISRDCAELTQVFRLKGACYKNILVEVLGVSDRSAPEEGDRS